jgi:hypothetical protein
MDLVGKKLNIKNKGVCGPEHWEPNVHSGCLPSTSIFLDLPKQKELISIEMSLGPKRIMLVPASLYTTDSHFSKSFPAQC